MATDVVFIAQLNARVRRAEHDLADIRLAADEARRRLATPTRLTLARQSIKDPAFQVCVFGVFMLGDLAPNSAPALKLLRDQVSQVDDDRVQSALAGAFDAYCAAIGYEAALPTIDAWLTHRRPNARRAVVEGLRVWTNRPYFNDHPVEAVRRLEALRSDPDPWVRQSIALALRDIDGAGA